MSTQYHPYKGKGWGKVLVTLGLLTLVASVLTFFSAPFHVRKFAAFPALAGGFFLLFGLTARCKLRTGKVLRRVLLAMAALAILGFGVLEAVIAVGARTEMRGEPDVVVVLGAQVKPWGPSVLLADRLDAAADYLKEHPELNVVVTGGQGPDEPSTEAAAMRDYLMEKGIAQERIWLEDEAHNTTQNLAYTKALLEKRGLDVEETHLLVVSNGFHLTRVRMLAGRHGLDISTLAAPASHAPSRIQSYIREAPALIKSWLLDR